ncbi:MAG: iron chaperone [Brevibacterium aurantiacum]|uniref:DUF1801 domain-containing protein n=1 Tax=Brevibacterium aurantiacum TaxID=273384 RepID=A0A1D7W7H2_BREAU|nr:MULTISPECIES: DUF1801 domain-containing protein [Brevibacterium]MDN5551970.1 DUF1801 domain-containing protein [Brevibacterium sp.]AOP54996.1 hypothetical protein BLSMQ_3296 [Brevibacterium aurantiacum]PCC51451.1 hypothetical protein CIK62_02780 [Brevibacterium aurantiacum]RCS92852.1 DUF1801 domain-containing protein [Brevibacterium aurantiacum]RCS99441.1 DUF1801 domain-containing protein [Brevibacterium aurantiacum]
MNVDDYIAGCDDEYKRGFLARLRDLSRSAAPTAEEGTKWGNPAYSLDTILFAFAGYAKHANFVFTPSTKEAFADQLGDFDTGKGSIKLYYDREIPTDLLSQMIAHRIHEAEVDGVKWM